MGRAGRIVGAMIAVLLALVIAVPAALADPPTHSMTIDATAIFTQGGQFTLGGPGQDDVAYDTDTPQTITLEEGTYEVFVGSAQAMDCDVTVDANGDWEYSANTNPCSYLSGQLTSTLTISGFPIMVDPSALSGGLVFDLSTDFFSTPKQFNLVPLDGSDYLLQDSSGEVSTCDFDLDDSGNVTYDPSDQGCLTGAGTATVEVNGEPLRIDATALSTENVSLINLGGDDGDQPSDVVQSWNVLPMDAGEGYVVSTDTGYDANLIANVDTSDTASVDASASGWASASGNTVTLTGYPVTIDATAIAPDSFAIDTGDPPQTFDAATVQHLQLAPADGQGTAGTYGYEFQSSQTRFDWGLSDAGTISYPTGLGSCVSGSGTATLTVSCNPGTAPHATGTLSMDRTTVYSTDPVSCGGVSWDTGKVTTSWLIHKTFTDVQVGTGQTFTPPRGDDGDVLYCEETATTSGFSVTVKSAEQIVYELPAQTLDGDFVDYPSGALLCGSTPCWYNQSSSAPYPEAQDWYEAPSAQCVSLEWSSSFAAGLSEADLALAEPHSEEITLERLTSNGGAVVIASHTFDTTPGNVGNEMTSFGSQDFSVGDYYAQSDPSLYFQPDYWVAGQGDLWFHYDTRYVGALYSLTKQDLGATLRCLITVKNGPASTPTTASTYVDGKVSTESHCAPIGEGPAQPASWVSTFPTDCITTLTRSGVGIPSKSVGQALTGAVGPAPPVVVPGGTALLSLNCTLPSGCVGTATLKTTTLSARIARSGHGTAKPVLLGSGHIAIRRGHKGVLRIRLTSRARKLIKAHKHGITATLGVTVHGKSHALEVVTLLVPSHRKRRR
jgi:hypothetical protein